MRTVRFSIYCIFKIIQKYFICTVFFAEVFLTGCLSTEGNLLIQGKVIDEHTKMKIAGREIIVQALVKTNEMVVSIDAGQFSTDSTGSFSYSLRKVRSAHYYNFYLVGDSSYWPGNKVLGLMELDQNARYLVFSMSKLVGVTIKISKQSKTPVRDTLFLYWKSNDVDGRFLYPYKIDNYIGDSYFGLTSALELRWIGGDVNSIIKTRVFADKKTKLYWELARNRRRKEITDTITCRRDLVNLVNFVY